VDECKPLARGARDATTTAAREAKERQAKSREAKAAAAAAAAAAADAAKAGPIMTFKDNPT
jgi:hypothetical protein